MLLRRTIGIFLTLLTGVTLYGLGYWQGTTATQGRENISLANEIALQTPISGQRPQRGIPPLIPRELKPREQLGESSFRELLTRGAWVQLEQWLVDHQLELEPGHGGDLVQFMSRQVNKYDAAAMREVLRAYLAHVPNDAGALFLLSDLQQIGGMREAALETLFNILDYPVDASIAAKARQLAEQIIKVVDIELKSRGALAEREAFWRHISQRLASSDYFRYEWARSLAELKRFNEARRILAETGTSDIGQDVIDDLIARIDIAAEGLQFERDGDRLLSAVSTQSGLSLTLLVDTGANITSFSKSALRALSAQNLDEEVRVRTAGGIVATGVYRVAEVEIQGRLFTDIRVLELPVDLPELDGLLGLDILNQLSIDPFALNTI